MRLQSALSWTLVSVGIRYALKILGNLALARMLSPDDFGLAAIVMSVVTGIEAITDVGTKPALIRSHRTDDDWLDTAWTLGLVRGAGITVLIALCSVPIADFFGDERLAPLIATTALMSFLVGLNSVAAIIHIRNLDVKRLTIIDTASAVISYVVMLGWAYFSPSAWALISGALVSTSAFAFASWFWLTPRRVRLTWDPEVIRELLNFGKWVFLSSIAGFIIVQGDRIGVGKLVGIAAVGVYSIGQTWSYALRALIGMVLSRIYLPIVSELHRRLDDFALKIVMMRRTVIAALIIPFSFGAAFAQPLIGLLYPEEFEGAGKIMQVLVVGGWFATLESLYNDQLMAKGEPAWLFAAQALSIVGMGIAFILMFGNSFNALSFAYIFSGGAAIRGIALLIAAERESLLRIFPDLSLTAIFLGLLYILSTMLVTPFGASLPITVLLSGFLVMLPFGAGICWWALKKILTTWDEITLEKPMENEGNP